MYEPDEVKKLRALVTLIEATAFYASSPSKEAAFAKKVARKNYCAEFSLIEEILDGCWYEKKFEEGTPALSKTQINDLIKTLGPMAIQALLEGKAAVVPIEPTGAMTDAGHHFLEEQLPQSGLAIDSSEVFEAMVAAGRIDAQAPTDDAEDADARNQEGYAKFA